ncbi:hypothetical protein N7535_008580 [Penicillium sp. DV-2018c]|nr:hypothetical protein N7535_008580 [Penicillium sp. DV-2018c]
MTYSATDINEKEQSKKTNSKYSSSDDQDNQTSMPMAQGTQILYHAAVGTNGIRLHPQPTADALDPLNWSKFQKHIILSIVMFKTMTDRLTNTSSSSDNRYFLFTYLTTTTVPSFPEIQDQYKISYSQVNWTVAVPALGLTVGPLIWSSLADIYGRRSIFLLGTTIALVSTVGAATSDKYSSYMAARFFQGFGVSPASTVGMAIVNDLFLDYERGQKLGLWVLALDAGLLLGPTFGSFLDLVSSIWINWFNAILFAILLLLELAFLPETLYPRNKMLQQMPRLDGQEALPTDIEKQPMGDFIASPALSPVEASLSDLRRTKRLPFINWRPIPGITHPKPWDPLIRFVLTFQLPTVAIAVIGYSFVWYWWVLSVITMIPAAYATYSSLIQGLLFLGLLLGTVVSEVCCSGRLSDYIVNKLSKRNGNIRVPEMRLWLAYPAMLLTAIGLIIWGISIDQNYHWMVGQVAFFFFAAGIQIGNMVSSSYVVDCYPLQTTSVITFYAVFLNLSAFINPFFIASWQESCGWTWTFTTQGIIVLVGGCLVFGGLHRFGAWMRAKAPQPSWVNPEFDMDP